jgi:predicted nucleotidyltransferase
VFVRDPLELPETGLIELCQRCHVSELALFGSVSRADFREDSDIDVLVAFEPDTSGGLFELVDLKESLTAVLGREIDLVSKRGLHSLNRGQIMDSATTIYSSSLGYREPRALDDAASRSAVPIDRDLLRPHVAAEACTGIAETINGVDRKTIGANDLRASAALYELHRLGEVLKRLSPKLKEDHPDVP